MKENYKILLATDYSEASMNAERYAVQFAKAAGASLTFLHIYTFPLSATPSLPVKYEDVKRKHRESELKALEQRRDAILQALGITGDQLHTECVVKEGSAGREITRTAYDLDMDFTIVGTHGTTGFRKIFYGTHAWEVIKKSSIPVLAVPQNGLFTGIKNIVFATEYRQGEIPVINYLTGIARKFNAEITVLHVTNYPLSRKFEADMFGRFKKEVLEKIHYEKLNIRLAVDEVISSGLEKFCEECPADWLVMSPERPYLMDRIFFPEYSMTRKMSFHTRVPLLSVPDHYNPEYAAFWKIFQLDENYIDEEL